MSSLSRRDAIALSTSSAAALLLAGCPGRGRPSASGSEPNVLRYALQTRPTRLDPAAVQDGDTIDLIQQIFEGLVQWNEKNEPSPNLAESWEISPDGKVYTFRLKQDVLFHPPYERKLTAEDFVYSLSRAFWPETNSAVATTYLNDIAGADEMQKGARSLSGVRAIDERTLQITLVGRRPYFLGKLTYPCAFAVCREAIEKVNGPFDERAMIGTGPFTLAEYRLGYKVTLSANARYHAGKPVLTGIERPIIPDSTARQTRYESGETDITDAQRADLPRIEADPVLKSQLRQFPRAAVWYLGMNPKAFAPFARREVRQAFAHAINKDALIRLALRGIGTRAEGVIPPGIPGHNPSFKGLEYAPEKARALLAKGGYPGGKGFPKLTIKFRTGYKQIEDGVLSIRNDLKQNLGIEVDTQQVEWAQFLTQLNANQVACAHVRWSADYLDPQNFLTVLLRSGSPENNFNYSNPEYDRLCDAADAEADPQKRIALYQQAERIVVDDAPWVCLYFQRDIELHKPYVKGLRESLLGHLPHITTTVRRTPS
jgi:ABC-type transport system substrate-binding protein